MATVTHGTYAGYTHGRCRCGLCRSANADYHRRRRQIHADHVDTLNLTHGTASTYRNYGCRCRPCTDANTATAAVYKARRRVGR